MGNNKVEKVSKIEWIVVILLFIIFFALFLYSDICHTTSRGIVFWECLFNGKLNEFYAYPYLGVEGSYLPEGTFTGAYDFILYVIFALWDFPLWCFEKVTQLSFLSVYGGRLYAKCIVLVFFVISAWILRKIVQILTVNENLANWAVFWYMTSSLVISSVVLQGGYDIISVCFTLLGIYLYIQNEDWKFVAAFAMAVTCKMFALFIFIPLILLRHKKISKILGRFLSVISLIAIPKVIIGISSIVAAILKQDKLADSFGKITAIQTDILLVSADADFVIPSNSIIAHSNIINDSMFANNAGAINFSNIPLFFFFTFGFWWVCWKKKQATQYEIVYYCLIGMSIFVLFVDLKPYWIILLVPYVVLMLVLNADRFSDNVILELLFSMGYVVFQSYKRYWCYSLEMVTKMLNIEPSVPLELEMCGSVKAIDVLQDISGISVQNIYSVFVCCFAVGLILFLYDNRPRVVRKQVLDFRNIRIWSRIRIVPAIIVVLLPFSEIAIYIIKTMI